MRGEPGWTLTETLASTGCFDRQDILDCLARFCRGMDRFDEELFLSAFHADAVIAAGDFVGGPVELYAWAAQLHERGQVATLHNLLNNTCDIDGDEAHSETYYLFAARNRDQTNWLAGGRYFDRLECRDGSLADCPAHQRHRMVRNGPEHADSVRRRPGHRRQRFAVSKPLRPVLPAAPGQPPRTAPPGERRCLA